MSKKDKSNLRPEEYAHGFDLNPDDFDTIDHMEEAKKQNKNQNRADINQSKKQ